MGKIAALQCTLDDVKTLKEVFRLTSLASKVKYAFQCMVCLGVMKPPVIFTTCCENLIACKDCIQDIRDIGFQTLFFLTLISFVGMDFQLVGLSAFRDIFLQITEKSMILWV